jgi:DNA-binding Xre family transcriptional regulator
MGVMIHMKVKCRMSVILAEKEMQLKDLKEKINLDYKHLSSIKTGNTMPTIPTALKIAKGLEVGLDDLWVEVEK